MSAPELLLLHFKGANGATSTSDSSPTQAAITLNGGLSLTNVQSRTHCTCINIPANAQAGGAYISTPIVNGAPLDILSNTGDFTIEGFVYISNSTSWSTSGNQIQVFDYGNDPSGTSDATGIHLHMAPQGGSGTLGMTVTLGTSIPGWASLSGSVALSPGANVSTWFHWAVQRRSGVPELYFNGKRMGIGGSATWTSYSFPGVSAISFGRIAANVGNTSSFFIDEIRVSNVCKYSGATYTAPDFTTTPFPDPTFREYLPPVLSLADPVTTHVDLTWTIPKLNPDPLVLLLHLESLTVVDSSSYGHTMTETNLTLDSTTPKFGVGALKNTATSTSTPQYVHTTYAKDTELDIFPDAVGDFTIEGWLRQDSSVSGSGYINYGDDPLQTGTENGFTFQFGVDNTGLLGVHVGSFWNSINASLPAYTVGTWYHWAMVRKAGIQDFYINGVSSQSTAAPRIVGHTYQAGAAPNIWVGWTPNVSGSNQPMSFDETRVLNGVAAYTPGVNFTPPVAPFAGPPPPPGYTMFKDTVEIGQITPGTNVNFTDVTVLPGEVVSYQVAAQDGSDNLVSGKSNAVVVSIPAAIKTVVTKFVGSAVYKAIQISKVGGIIPRIWPSKKNNTVYG